MSLGSPLVGKKNPVTSKTILDLLPKICPGIVFSQNELDDYTAIIGRLHSMVCSHDSLKSKQLLRITAIQLSLSGRIGIHLLIRTAFLGTTFIIQR